MWNGRKNLVFAGAAAVFLILTLINFHGITAPDVSLETSDAPIYQVRQIKQMMDEGRVASASPAIGLGSIGPILIGDFTALFYRIIPEFKVEECIMAFSIFWISMFFFLFLRDRKYRTMSALIGAVALGFSVVLLSISKAGHTGKFTGMAYVVGAMWLMGRSISGRGWIWALWAGLFVGLSLAQSKDFAMLLMIGVGAFWIRELIVKSLAWKRPAYSILAQYLAAAVVAVIVMWPVMKILVPQGDTTTSTGPAAVKEDKSQKWEWATQWSLPSDELTKLICHSYCGFDSWNQQAPYWGRMGRSAGWERQKNNPGMFRNFTQTNEYLGVVVFILALCGLAGFLPRYKQQTLDDDVDSPPHDGVFWAVLGLVSLLLALGKYGPLYRLFYELPMMSTIRNPVKFMHLVTIAVAMLSAQGAYLVEQLSYKPERDRRWRLASLFLPAGAVVFFFISLSAGAPWQGDALAGRWGADGFSPQMEGIKAAMSSGVSRSLFLSILALGIIVTILPLKSLFAKPAGRNGVLIALLALVGWDAIGANVNYISYDNPSTLYRSNTVIDYLKTMPEYRSKFIPLHFQVFNQWNSVLVPYFFFKSADIPAESRRSPDLQAFYTALGNNPRRMWQLSGVRSLILPQQYEAELTRLLGPGTSKVKRFNLAQTESGGVTSVFVPEGKDAQFLILNNSSAIPCGKWYAKAEIMTWDKMISALPGLSWDPDKVILVEQSDVTMPGTSISSAAGTGVCNLVEYKANELKIESQADADGWILVNDYYDGKWSAAIDGKRIPIHRANGIFRAVQVPAGKHVLSMRFSGNTDTFWIPMGALILLACLSLATWLIGLMRRSGAVPA